MTDSLQRTIAALRMWGMAARAEDVDLRALCDAAEASLRSPPREPRVEPRVCEGCGRSENLPRACAYCGTTLRDAAPKINGGQGHEAAARCPTEGIAPSEATRLTADASGRMADATQRGQLGADAGSIPAPTTINEGGQESVRAAADTGSERDPVPPSPDAELVARCERLAKDGTHAQCADALWDAGHAIERLSADLRAEERGQDSLRRVIAELIDSYDAYKRAAPPLDGPRPPEWDRWQIAWKEARAAAPKINEDK